LARCPALPRLRNGARWARRCRVVRPYPEEIEDARWSTERADQLAEIERIYPLPAMESLSLAYRHTRTGKIMVHKYAGKDKEGNEVWLPVATPFGVPARLRAVDQQGAYGLRVTVRGMDGQGWGGRPVRQEQAQGILVAALGVLARHFRYEQAA
jgi:hypothetical protein